MISSLHESRPDDLRRRLVEAALRARARHAHFRALGDLNAFLADRDVVHHATALAFSALLEPGLPAELVPAARPSGPFVLRAHPKLASRIEDLAALVANHVPMINHGDEATAEHGLAFGAAFFGLEVETFEAWLARLTAELWSPYRV